MTYVNKAQKKRLFDLLNSVEKKTPIDSFSSAGGCVFFKNKGLGREDIKKIGELYCDNLTVDEFYFALKEECKKTQRKSLEAKEAFYCKCKKGHFWVRYRPDIWRDLQYICMTQMSAEIQQEKSGIRIKYYFEKEKVMFRRNLTGVIVFVIWGLLLILFALYNILFKHVMVQEQKELLIMGIFMQIIALFGYKTHVLNKNESDAVLEQISGEYRIKEFLPSSYWPNRMVPDEVRVISKQEAEDLLGRRIVLQKDIFYGYYYYYEFPLDEESFMERRDEKLDAPQYTVKKINQNEIYQLWDENWLSQNSIPVFEEYIEISLDRSVDERNGLKDQYLPKFYVLSDETLLMMLVNEFFLLERC